MTLPETIDIDPDEWHRKIYDEELSDEARQQVREFVEGQLTDRVDALLEEAIYKRYQSDKD